MERILKYFNQNWNLYIGGVLFALLLIFVVACDNRTDGDPIGPANIGSSSLIVVTPTTVTVTKGSEITFTATGGTEPLTWGVSNTTLASVGSDTGTVTAGASTGTVGISVTDANGSIGTAVLQISDKSLIVAPSTAQVQKTLTQQYAVTGATDPTFWSVASTSIGTIDTDTGLFTAGVSLGSTTITVLDADGDTATAEVEVISRTIVVTPIAAGPYSSGNQAFTATTGGVAGTYSWTVSGESGGYEGASVTVATAPAVGTTLTFLEPSAVEGDQTLVITATDGNGDTGTAQITLDASDE